MRLVVAILVCSFGCDGSRATKPPTAPPVEVVLERSSGLPRFEIQATFDLNLDPAPHIQPIAAAVANARAVCSRGSDAKPSLAAVLDVQVIGKQLHVSSRNSTGKCLAREIDGKVIDDPVDYSVELLVSAS
jgi:hypothetical protein